MSDLTDLIAARRNDPAFRARLQRRLTEDKAILDKIAATSASVDTVEDE